MTNYECRKSPIFVAIKHENILFARKYHGKSNEGEREKICSPTESIRMDGMKWKRITALIIIRREKKWQYKRDDFRSNKVANAECQVAAIAANEIICAPFFLWFRRADRKPANAVATIFSV